MGTQTHLGEPWEESGTGYPEQECDKHLFAFFSSSWWQEESWLDVRVSLTGQCVSFRKQREKTSRHLAVIPFQAVSACWMTWCTLDGQTGWVFCGAAAPGSIYSLNCTLEMLSPMIHRAEPGVLVLRDLAILVPFARVMCLSLGSHTYPSVCQDSDNWALIHFPGVSFC